MTKEITKAIILQEIQDKFALREFEPEVFTFSERVVPTYNIEPHLKTARINLADVTITQIGGRYFYTVPQKKKWTLHRYVVVFESGAFTASGVYISRPKVESAYFSYLDLTAAQNTSYAVDLPKDAVLYAGDQLGINIDGFTTTGDLRLYIDYDEEVLR